MRQSGEQIVENLGIAPGLRILAVGCATALPPSRRPTWTFRFDGSPQQLLAQFRDYYGPTMNAFEAARAAGHERDLEAELETLFQEQNAGDDRTSIAATFLRVTVDR
jgi:hypothetical protein